MASLFYTAVFHMASITHFARIEFTSLRVSTENNPSSREALIGSNRSRPFCVRTLD